MKILQDLAAPIGRILLSAIFVLAGINKIGSYDSTMQYMDGFGVPGSLLPLVIVAEIGLGLAVAFGLFSRLSALGLAGFSIVSAMIFHGNIGDQMQFILFSKNFAMAGGFLMIWANGPGAYALDNIAGIGRYSNIPKGHEAA